MSADSVQKMDKTPITANEAFEKCIELLEGSANLHFAYSDPSRDRYGEPSPDRDKWKWSGEFLQDAANKIRKLRGGPENGLGICNLSAVPHQRCQNDNWVQIGNMTKEDK